MSKLTIPFIKSRGFECGQACAAMMIKYYFPKFKPNFDEINQIIHHQKGKYSFPAQLAILLDHYRVSAKVYSSDDLKTSTEDPDQFHHWFGEEYDAQIKKIDIASFDWMAQTIRPKDLFLKKETAFTVIISEYEKGNLVGLPIDWNRATGKAGPYEGHFVLIAGVDGNDLLIHDPDIGPYQRHPASVIKMAWEHPAIADDYLVAYGKK